MNREIGVKRLYSLGDYKNITFDDIIVEVPSELMFDTELVSQIKFLQLVSVEVAFRKYLNIMEQFPLTAEERGVVELEKIRQDTVNSIKTILNGKTEA
jgi:hypothetical protein